MTRKLAAALTLLTAIAHTTTAQALGLGNIEVSSKLNQPLNAKVRLLSIPRQDMQNLGNIKVRLASNEAFQRAGLERPFVLSTLRFKVAPTGDTAANISISTTQPIKEPFLNFLLEIDWPNGRILREYTVLLDPPLYRADATLAPINMADNQGTQTEPLSTRPVADEATTSTRTITSRPPRATRPNRVPAAAIGEGEYGVRRGDSLWVIADRMRAGSTLSREQMMAAIYDANRHAFIRGNMNLLREGQALRRPSNEEAAAVSDSKALGMINAHRSRWTDYREEVADSAETAAVTTTRPQADSDSETATTETSKSPLTILGEGRGETLGSTGAGQDPKIRAQLSELLEENKRVQQENKNLEKDLAATKKLVETMQQQLDKVLKVQSDLLAQLESQAKKQGQSGAQTASESPTDSTQVAAATDPTVPDTTAVATPPATGTTEPPVTAQPDQSGSATTDTSTTPGTETTAGFSVGDLTGKPSTPPNTNPDSWSSDSSQTPPGDSTAGGTTTATPATPEQTATQAEPGETSAGTTTSSAPDPTTAQVTDGQTPGDATPTDTTAGAATPDSTSPDPATPEAEAADMLGVMNSTVNDNVPGGWLTVAGVGGGLALLLVGVPLLRRQRRRREEDAQREAELLDSLGQLNPEDGQSAESGKAPIDLDFSLPDDNAEHLTQPDDVLEEVDVYIAYERYDQAQTLIGEALAKAPSNLSYLLKRLEIDAAMGQVEAFEQHAKPLFDVTGGQGPAWEQALLLWDSLHTQRALLGGTTAANNETALAAGAAALVGAAGAASAADAMGLDDSSLDMDFDFEDTAQGQEEITGSGDLDFDLQDTGKEGDTQLEDADLDMGLDMDTDTSSHDLTDDDLGMDFSLDQDSSGTMDDADHGLDLELDDGATPASAADSLDMDFDLDMNLDEAQAPSADSSTTPAASDDELSMDFDLDEGLEMSLDDDIQAPSTDSSTASASSARSDDELDMGFDLDEGLDMSLDDEQAPSTDNSTVASDDDALDMDFEPDAGLDESLDMTADTAGEAELDFSASDDDSSLNLADLDDLGEEAHETDNTALELELEAAASTAESSLDSGELEMDFDMDEGLELGAADAGSSTDTASQDEDLGMEGFELDMDGGESQEDIATIDGSTLDTDDEDLGLDFSEDLGRTDDALDANTLSVAGVDDEALDFDLSLDEDQDIAPDEMSLSTPELTLETDSDLTLETEAELGLDSMGLDLAEDSDFSLQTVDDNEVLELSLPGSNSNTSDDLESLLGQLEDAQGLDAMDSLDFGAADEVSAKFDLAQMYLDMDDTDNARSTLLEVLAEGSEEQKTRARRMLESVGEPA